MEKSSFSVSLVKMKPLCNYPCESKCCGKQWNVEALCEFKSPLFTAAVAGGKAKDCACTFKYPSLQLVCALVNVSPTHSLCFWRTRRGALFLHRGQAACFIPWKRTKSFLRRGFKVCKTGIGSFFLFRDRLIVFGIKRRRAERVPLWGFQLQQNRATHPASERAQTHSGEEIWVCKTNPLVAATIK